MYWVGVLEWDYNNGGCFGAAGVWMECGWSVDGVDRSYAIGEGERSD